LCAGPRCTDENLRIEYRWAGNDLGGGFNRSTQRCGWPSQPGSHTAVNS